MSHFCWHDPITLIKPYYVFRVNSLPFSSQVSVSIHIHLQIGIVRAPNHREIQNKSTKLGLWFSNASTLVFPLHPDQLSQLGNFSELLTLILFLQGRR